MMTARLRAQAVLVLLASTAALSVTGQNLNIGSMEWVVGDSGTTTLTVCAADALADGVSLIVNSPEFGITDYLGATISDNANCAEFSDGQLQLPAALTSYKLQVVESGSDVPTQTGYVSFTLAITQTVINCSGTELALVTITNGIFADETCLPGPEGVCYKPAQDPRVCVLGLDESTTDLQVCVTQTPAGGSDISNGVLVGLQLDYEGGSFIFVPNQSTLMELIYRPQGGNASVAACDANNCFLDNFSPSIYLYELCGVYGDGGKVTSVSTGSFQDLELTVVETGDVLDFYFTNLYQEQVYNVYTGSSPEMTLGTHPITLDCTGVPPGEHCYGFIVYADSNQTPAYLAVGDVEETNQVITNTQIPAFKGTNSDALVHH